MGSSSNLGICPNIFRVLFCIVNGMILLLGLVGVGISIYLLVVNNNYQFITGNSIVSGAVLVMVGSLATIVIAGLGFVGAAFKWRPVLVIYVVVLVIIVLLEIVGGIVSYAFRDNLAPVAQGQFATLIENEIAMYRRNQDDSDYSPSANTAVDFIQNTFMCCGAGNTSMDWAIHNPAYLRDNSNMLPESCLCQFGDENCARTVFDFVVGNDSYTGTVNQTAWTNSCVESTRHAVFALAIVGGGIGIAIGVLELLGVLVGIGLCICITTSDKAKEMV